MTTDWTAEPIRGYCTAWPTRDFGTDKIAAVLSTGVRSDRIGKTAHKSYVALTESSPAIALQSRTVDSARFEAIEKLPIGPIVLCERMAAYPTNLLRKLEVLRKDNRGSLLVAYNGHVVDKATNPVNPFDFRSAIDKIASGLRTADREFAKPLLEQYFERLSVDWTKLGKRARAQVLSDARAFLGTLNIDPLVGAWESRLTVNLATVADKTVKVIRETFLPSIQQSLSLVETVAVENIAKQPGLFARDEMGRRSNALTKKVRKVVEQGLKDGLGRNEIAKEIMKVGNGYWDKRGLNYARVVAANSVARARSHSSLVAYRDAGIEQLEVQAVLDEATTDICRSLDGTIISVGDAWKHNLAINDIKDPEDIGKVAPFMRTKMNRETGQREVLTGSGKVYATITRSGIGVADDRGDFKQGMGAKKLGKEGVSTPPYHHGCRSFTVPRTSYISVPAGRNAKTYPTPVTRPTKPAKATQRPPRVTRAPTLDDPVTVQNAVPRAPGHTIPGPKKVSPKPQKVSPEPEDDGPVTVRNNPRATEYLIPPRGGLDKASDSVQFSIDSAMNAMLSMVGEATVIKGRDLTMVELGQALRSFLLAQVGKPFTGNSLRVSVPKLEGLGFKTTAMDQQSAWKKAMQFAGPKLRGIIRYRQVPSIRAGKHIGYYPDRDLIVVRSSKEEASILRAVQFYIDSLGDHRFAGNTVRNWRAMPGPLVRVGVDYYALTGAWIDRYDGRVYGNRLWLENKFESEYSFTLNEIDKYFGNDNITALWAQVAPRFLKGASVSLATNWERFPEQVAGYVALQSGALFEVSDAS